ncbi:MAG: hypothetical protein JO007_17615 [Alphaproteobacteria bacterium]|nr:hypothetical protein [Alphaproteobacteria bacterium]
MASPAEPLGGLDFADQPLIAVLHTISAALVEVFGPMLGGPMLGGPMFWAA